jgi:CspA family cold shock protein
VSTGTVKWFNANKGFGFINVHDASRDVFVHHSALQANGFRELREPRRVKFDLVRGNKGCEAVRPL